jgi:hypothetical protein
MSNPEVPDFGQLLAPFIGSVPEDYVPNFLAMLERGAAERYRTWAREIPEHSEGLLMCAAREDEIADTVDALFPIADDIREEIAVPLPAARDTYYAVFANLDLHDQLAVQAGAERQGAAAWRAMLDDQTDPEVREKLQHCSLLEEASASYLEDVVLA